MARVDYEFPISAMHGKVCKHSSLIFGKNGLSGKTYTSKICNPRTSALTIDELTNRATFKSASDYAKAQMQDPTKRQAAEVRFKAAKEAGSTKYLSLRTFLMGESFSGNEVTA